MLEIQNEAELKYIKKRKEDLSLNNSFTLSLNQSGENEESPVQNHAQVKILSF